MNDFRGLKKVCEDIKDQIRTLNKGTEESKGIANIFQMGVEAVMKNA